jgi:hypothetical protein
MKKHDYFQSLIRKNIIAADYCDKKQWKKERARDSTR